MTTPTAVKPSTVDAAAQASIGAAARELHPPTVRVEAARLADIVRRERQSHLGYLAEVLAAEVDDRSERRRTRRINDAKFPDSNASPSSTSMPSPPSPPPPWATSLPGTTWTPGNPSCCSATAVPAKAISSSDWA